MKFNPSDPDHPQLNRKYVSTLKRCKIIEMHPGHNGTNIPYLQPVQRDALAFKVGMPCMLEVVLVNGIVDHPEAVQFIIANRHFYLEMRITAGWLHLGSEFRQEACVESGGFRCGRHSSCFRACPA